MALGFSNTGTSGGGDFLPIVKYDARAGRFFRVDREEGTSTPVDITRTFKAVFDFENVETGWIAFVAGSAPDFQMTPMDVPNVEKPSARNFAIICSTYGPLGVALTRRSVKVTTTFHSAKRKPPKLMPAPCLRQPN